MRIDEKYARILESEMRVMSQLLNERLADLNRRVSRHINSTKIRTRSASNRSVFWSQNSGLKKQIQKEYNKLASQVIQDTMNGAGMASFLNDQKGAEVLANYFKGSGIDAATAKKYSEKAVFAFGAYASRISEISPRVLEYVQLNQSIVETYVRAGIYEGKSAASIAREMKKLHANPAEVFTVNEKANYWRQVKFPNKGRGVYKSIQKNLERITRTEMNRAYHYQDYLRRNAQPFVTGIKIELSGSHPIYDICDEMVGVYPKTFVFLGWHPHCLCRTVSDMLPEDKMKSYLSDGKISVNDYTTRIPANASKYVKKNFKKYKKMDWATNNFTQSGNVRKSIANTARQKAPGSRVTTTGNYNSAASRAKKALNKSQQKTLQGFSSGQYTIVNGYARGLKKYAGKSESIMPQIAELDDIIAQAPKYNGKAYHAVQNPGPNFQSIISGSKKGDLMVDPGFMFAGNNAGTIGRFTNNGSVVFEIENFTGVAIKDITGKNEIISARNTVFEIVKIEQRTINKKNVTFITAKII